MEKNNEKNLQTYIQPEMEEIEVKIEVNILSNEDADDGGDM